MVFRVAQGKLELPNHQVLKVMVVGHQPSFAYQGVWWCHAHEVSLRSASDWALERHGSYHREMSAENDVTVVSGVKKSSIGLRQL